MRISHKHKLIWVSKPKTGSTSYRALLDPFCEIKSTDATGDFYHHSSLSKIQTIFLERGWDFDAYKKVVPVRNPYDLLVSLYTYSKTDINGVRWWQVDQKKYNPEKMMGFTQWVLDERNVAWFQAMHRLETYIMDSKGNDLSDLIFKPCSEEEKFKAFIKEFCHLDLSAELIPKLNTTSKPQYLVDEVKECYSTNAVSSMIEEVFSFEIKMFQFINEKYT